MINPPKESVFNILYFFWKMIIYRARDHTSPHRERVCMCGQNLQSLFSFKRKKEKSKILIFQRLFQLFPVFLDSRGYLTRIAEFNPTLLHSRKKGVTTEKLNFFFGFSFRDIFENLWYTNTIIRALYLPVIWWFSQSTMFVKENSSSSR